MLKHCSVRAWSPSAFLVSKCGLDYSSKAYSTGNIGHYQYPRIQEPPVQSPKTLPNLAFVTPPLTSNVLYPTPVVLYPTQCSRHPLPTNWLKSSAFPGIQALPLTPSIRLSVVASRAVSLKSAYWCDWLLGCLCTILGFSSFAKVSTFHCLCILYYD